MNVTITSPTSDTLWLPSGNPIEYSLTSDSYTATGHYYDIRIYVNGSVVLRRMITSGEQTITIDIAPVVRDFLADSFNNGRTSIDMLDASEQCYASIDAKVGSSTSVMSSYVEGDEVLVLNATASFEEEKALDEFFNRNEVAQWAKPCGPQVTILPPLGNLTRAQMDSAYEIGQNDPHVFTMKFQNLLQGKWTNIYIRYFNHNGIYDSQSYSDMPAFRDTPVWIDVPLSSTITRTKGWYIAIFLVNGTSYMSSAILYHVSECSHDFYSVLYKSRFGGWWYIPTHLKHYRTLGVSTTTMDLARTSISAHMRDRRAVSVRATGQWQLNTDFIGKQEHITEIEDMLTSPNIYIMKSTASGTQYIPVTLVDNSYSIADRKQDHLPQYTFTFNEAFDIVR